MRHCLGKLCFGITGNKSCWDRFGSVSLPGWGQGWGGPPGLLQTPHTLKCAGTGGGGGHVGLEVGLLESVQRCGNRGKWEDVEEAGFEGGSLNPSPNTL